MSWKFVFNPENMKLTYLYAALCAAREGGYHFLLWEDNVIMSEDCKFTGITKKDLF